MKQNIFGGSFGGPIGKEAQAGFFFVNYQGTRQRSGLSPGTLISNSRLPAFYRPDRSDDARSMAAFGVPSIDPVIHNLLNLQSDQFGHVARRVSDSFHCGTPGQTRIIHRQQAWKIHRRSVHCELGSRISWRK